MADDNWYRLGEHGAIIPCRHGKAEYERWAGLHPKDLVVRQSHARGAISTVFYGNDLAGGEPHPLGPQLFETQVFIGKRRPDRQWHGFQMRYRRYEHALRGHEFLHERMRSGDGDPGGAWYALRAAVDEWEAEDILRECPPQAQIESSPATTPCAIAGSPSSEESSASSDPKPASPG